MLAESYQNAKGWDTEMQILSIMADLVPFDDIKKHIPGLSRHCLHILEHGRGAAVPLSNIVRVRIDDVHLNHFLSFITSPHVVQDLPFGQRYLKLSDGRIL